MQPRSSPAMFSSRLVAVMLLCACEPMVLPPFVPPTDTSFDADLDAPRPDVPPIDAPRADAPVVRPDTPGADVPGLDGGDPDFDAGTLLPILIDGALDEPEWDGGIVARSSGVGIGPFAGSSLLSLRVLSDATNVYLAIEGVLTNGAVIAYIDTGGSGVSLGLAGLGDTSGAVDAALSRSWTLADPSITPAYGWGAASFAIAPTAANGEVGFRELSQIGAHRLAMRDLNACGSEACEARIARSELGSPSRLRIAVRIATPFDAALVALPFEADADTTIMSYTSVVLSP